MQGHLKLDHFKTSRLTPEVECLPWIAQVVPDNKFMAPVEWFLWHLDLGYQRDQ